MKHKDSSLQDSERRHDRSPEQRAADRHHEDAKPQRATLDGYGQTREARYLDHLKRNAAKNETGEVLRSGAASPKPRQ